MASTYFIPISILLATTQIQGQAGSCPLGSCSLVSQINICTLNETAASGGCSDSCVTALRGNSTVEECCNTIVQSIINAFSDGQNGGICGEEGAQTQFGEILDRVNGARPVALAREIHEGTYIVSQRDFMYSCNGCIKSIQLAVSRDGQIQEGIKFHTFANRTGDKSIVQSVEDVTEWSSSVVSMLMTQDRRVVEYRPSGSSEVCFSQGDVFGFTIEAGSGITVLTRFSSDTSDVILNASSTISGCPQLSDNGLYTTVESFHISPLIHIVTGGFPPTEPPRTEPTIQTDIRTPPDTPITPPNPPPPDPTDPQTGDVSLQGSGSTIYAASGLAVAICILLIVVIIVVILIYIRRRNHNRNAQYGDNHNLGNSISVDSNAAYGISNHFEDGDHMDSNEAYTASNPIIGVGDHMDSNEAYGISIHIGAGDHMESNEAYGVLLQQTDTLQEFEDDTPYAHTYDYPMVDLNHLETKANEAYGTAVVQQ